jgi:hypothetical protein
MYIARIQRYEPGFAGKLRAQGCAHAQSFFEYSTENCGAHTFLAAQLTGC